MLKKKLNQHIYHQLALASNRKGSGIGKDIDVLARAFRVSHNGCLQNDLALRTSCISTVGWNWKKCPEILAETYNNDHCVSVSSLKLIFRTNTLLVFMPPQKPWLFLFEYSTLRLCAIPLSVRCMFTVGILPCENVLIIPAAGSCFIHWLVVCIFQGLVIGLLAIFRGPCATETLDLPREWTLGWTQIGQLLLHLKVTWRTSGKIMAGKFLSAAHF